MEGMEDKDEKIAGEGAKGTGEEVVSIRCTRHKKRFNVPKWWTEIVSCWLCPSCYEKLSEEEREKYKPKKKDGTQKPREAVEGKPVVFPKKARTEYEKPPSEEEKQPPKTKRPYHRREALGTGRIEDNPMLAGLLPRFKIECQKCGETVRCHYSWFDKSTVLCPSCYSSMTEYEVFRFHDAHKAEKPPYVEDSRPMPIKAMELIKPQEMSEIYKRAAWTKDSGMVENGGRWTNERVMEAKPSELRNAVKAGKVSMARYRIEMGRRKNVEYYDMFSMVPGRRLSQLNS